MILALLAGHRLVSQRSSQWVFSCNRTFSNKSLIDASVCFSSSVGFAGMFEAVANWEYLWKYASV